MNKYTAKATEKPPAVIDVKMSIGINKNKWRQYQAEGYNSTSLETMLKEDISRAITRGSPDTIHRLLDGDVLAIEVGEYY